VRPKKKNGSPQRHGDTARQSRKLSAFSRQLSAFGCWRLAFGLAGSRRADCAKSSRPAKILMISSTEEDYEFSVPSAASVVNRPFQGVFSVASVTSVASLSCLSALCLCITNSRNLRMPRQFRDKRHFRLAAPAHPSALSATSALSGFDFSLFSSAPQRLCGEYSLVAASPRCASPVTSLNPFVFSGRYSCLRRIKSESRRPRRRADSSLRPPPPLRSPVSFFVSSQRLCASPVNSAVRKSPRSIKADAGRLQGSVVNQPCA